MKHNEIRAQLKLRGVRISDVARAINVSEAAIHRAINGQSRSRNAEQAVAEALGTTRIEVFGLNKREKGGET